MSALLRHRIRCSPKVWRRPFSSTASWREIRDTADLANRIRPNYLETPSTDLLSLQWPAPPRNILLVKKDGVESVSDSLVEFAKHINTSYPTTILLEPAAASSLHERLPFPVYTTTNPSSPPLSAKTDLTTTLGGDGTILHASSLFSHTASVPPVLSFSLGSLGFLSEWHFSDYKRAFRDVYMSGADAPPAYPLSSSTGDKASRTYTEHDTTIPLKNDLSTGWSSIRGKSVGRQRAARILLRHRLRVTVREGQEKKQASASLNKGLTKGSIEVTDTNPVFALNELILHRGAAPHLTHIDIAVGGRHLTSAVADGMIVSSPTGSTAYSLSSGGSIIHPLVASLLLTPICPRSLSFRPLVLPANSSITLALNARNRAREIELSVDGQRRKGGLCVGMEVQIEGEEVKRSEDDWSGGVPCVMRVGGGVEASGDEGWVTGLNGLLKFNHPFGEESG